MISLAITLGAAVQLALNAEPQTRFKMVAAGWFWLISIWQHFCQKAVGLSKNQGSFYRGYMGFIGYLGI